MKQKHSNIISITALLLSIAIPLAAGLLKDGTIYIFKSKAERYNKLTERVEYNEKEIAVIKSEMLTEQKVREIMKSNNAELINMLFEKGYIRVGK